MDCSLNLTLIPIHSTLSPRFTIKMMNALHYVISWSCCEDAQLQELKVKLLNSLKCLKNEDKTLENSKTDVLLDQTNKVR